MASKIVCDACGTECDTSDGAPLIAVEDWGRIVISGMTRDYCPICKGHVFDAIEIAESERNHSTVGFVRRPFRRPDPGPAERVRVPDPDDLAF